MKIVKEDIQNLERSINNNKVDAVGSMPIVMADAFDDSEKKQKQVDEVIEEQSKKEVKLNKVIGAEKQPVPNLPETPKTMLEESLFEDYDPDIRHYSDMLFDMIEEGSVDAADIAKDLIYWCSEESIKEYMRVNYLTSEFIDDEDIEENLNESTALQHERIKNVKSYLEKALSAVDTYIDNINESLNESYICEAEDASIYRYKLVEKVKEYIEEGHINKDKFIDAILDWYCTDNMFVPFLYDCGFLSEDEIDSIINESLMTEDTEEDRYYAALDIPKGPERKKVAAERRKEFLKKYGLKDRSKEWKNAKGKDNPEEEADLFTKVNDELFPYDMEEVKLWTKFPNIPASKRYHQGDIGSDYDDNILIWADEDEDFEFAQKVADAYDLNITPPKQSGKYKVVRIDIPA